MVSHRGTLKKTKKSFKSGHSSKRSIKAASKGKVEKKTQSGPKTNKTQYKSDRRNNANQLKKNKIVKALNERALFDNAKTERIVTVIPLTSNVTSNEIVNQILGEEEQLSIKEDITVKSVYVSRFKAHLKIILPDTNDFLSILDAAKVSDFVVLGMSVSEEVSPKWGEQIIRAIEAQGIASVYGVVPDVIKAYPNKKNLQQDVMKSLSSYYGHFFPDYQKLYTTESPSDALNLLRNICQKLPKSIHWRDDRGYMIADNITTAESNKEGEGYLVVEGTVRGTGFDIDNLVNLPGLGDFQVDRIDKFGSEEILPSENRETLDELVDGDEEMEQDSDDDHHAAFDLVDKAAAVQERKKLPKGVSSYQAKWLMDDDIEEMIEENGEAEEAEETEDAEEAGDDDDDDDAMDTDLSPEEEARQLEQFKKRAKEELEFPDEIELRPEEKAIERISRYRGVKSLSNCIWDYDEEDSHRPADWLRYLRVKNYSGMKKTAVDGLKQNATVRAGDRCKMYISIPGSILSQIKDPSTTPFVVYGLLTNEHKLSVCHFTCETWESYELPIKSKEVMYVQYGSRRVKIEPLFSQPSRNPNGVSKFLRFLHKGTSAMATAIVPISFTGSPAIFFKQNDQGEVEIVADGTFVDSDYTKILAKRSVLTGEVFKIHKSVVTVRYMFFHYEDVLAYRNVPLFTKMGRSGLIKESLGTHGYFKASFDGSLNAQDIVAMALYKRMWPRAVE
ncbi:DEKNAAC101451 [Brettanomyces naardenensis]|uniref:DEKNAAC101451 n=1 Tax=Brettanomyces naardenensis TaxID=13370 RepID=A0A448YHV6_BRENA|nr:DEKNAAC101451 [Brettanomyces naardenensis]